MGACLSNQQRADQTAPKVPRRSRRVPVTERDLAVLAIKASRDRLENQQAQWRSCSERCRRTALQLARDGKRERALLVMRRHKLLERRWVHAEGALLKLEAALAAVDQAEMQRTILEDIARGTRILEAYTREVEMERVEDLLLESDAAMERVHEMQHALAHQLTPDMEREAEAELEALTRQVSMGAGRDPGPRRREPRRRVERVPVCGVEAGVTPSVSVGDGETSPPQRASAERQPLPAL
eukprot:ctg_178.g135